MVVVRCCGVLFTLVLLVTDGRVVVVWFETLGRELLLGWLETPGREVLLVCVVVVVVVGLLVLLPPEYPPRLLFTLL